MQFSTPSEINFTVKVHFSDIFYLSNFFPWFIIYSAWIYLLNKVQEGLSSCQMVNVLTLLCFWTFLSFVMFCLISGRTQRQVIDYVKDSEFKKVPFERWDFSVDLCLNVTTFLLHFIFLQKSTHQWERQSMSAFIYFPRTFIEINQITHSLTTRLIYTSFFQYDLSQFHSSQIIMSPCSIFTRWTLRQAKTFFHKYFIDT